MPITEAQVQERMKGLGGSDVAVVLGLNPYKSPLELYAEKRGELAPPDLSDNENVEAGVILEDGIAKLAERRMSRKLGREVKLRRCNLTLTNPKYPWLLAHIDRDVVGEERGVELKNVGARAAVHWGEDGTDEVPDYYLPQPHTYMIIKEYPVWTVAGYFGGGDLGLYEIAANKEFAEIIIERTHDFWHKHVLAGVPPEFDPGHPAAAQTLKRLYPGTNGQELRADGSLEHWRAIWEEAEELSKRYAKSAELAKLHLTGAMGGAAKLRFSDNAWLERKQIARKAYEVPASTYISATLKKPKE